MTSAVIGAAGATVEIHDGASGLRWDFALRHGWRPKPKVSATPKRVTKAVNAAWVLTDTGASVPDPPRPEPRVVPPLPSQIIADRTRASLAGYREGREAAAAAAPAPVGRGVAEYRKGQIARKKRAPKRSKPTTPFGAEFASGPSEDNTRRVLLGMKKGQTLKQHPPLLITRIKAGTSDDRWHVRTDHASDMGSNLPLDDTVSAIWGTKRVQEKLPATEGQLTGDERHYLRRYLIGSRTGSETSAPVGVAGYSGGSEVWDEKWRIKKPAPTPPYQVLDVLGPPRKYPKRIEKLVAQAAVEGPAILERAKARRAARLAGTAAPRRKAHTATEVLKLAGVRHGTQWRTGRDIAQGLAGNPTAPTALFNAATAALKRRRLPEDAKEMAWALAKAANVIGLGSVNDYVEGFRLLLG